MAADLPSMAETEQYVVLRQLDGPLDLVLVQVAPQGVGQMDPRDRSSDGIRRARRSALTSSPPGAAACVPGCWPHRPRCSRSDPGSTVPWGWPRWLIAVRSPPRRRSPPRARRPTVHEPQAAGPGGRHSGWSPWSRFTFLSAAAAPAGPSPRPPSRFIRALISAPSRKTRPEIHSQIIRITTAAREP